MNEPMQPESHINRYQWPALPRAEYLADFPHTLDAREMEESGATLREYCQLLSRRRWTVLTTVVVLTTLAAIYCFKAKPVYRASARVQVDPESPQMDSLNALYQPVTADPDFLQTQIQVMKTDQLAWFTIQQLQLQDNSNFTGNVLPPGDPNSHKLALLRRFKKNLSADVVTGSRVIQVNFESTDPSLAASVVNALVENFIERNFRLKYDATRQASGRMEQQLDELKAKVEKSQKALVDYQQQHAITDVSEKENVVEQRFGQLSTDLTAAQNERIQKEALYKLVRTKPEAVITLGQGQLLQGLLQKKADVHSQYVETVAQYGPAYPRALRLQKQLIDADAQIEAERNRVVSRITDDYDTAVSREELLQHALEKQKQELAELNNLLIQQNILSGEFETNQKLYQDLLRRLKEGTISAGLRTNNLHIVDPALVPNEPVRPLKLLTIMAALMASLILGVSLAFAQDDWDNSIRNADEIEVMMSSPALAIIPAMHDFAERKLAWRGAARHSHGALVPIAVPALAVLRQPKSPLAEAYRALRTAVLFAISKRRSYTLLVTSANSGEGKTCTAVNLATAMAQSGASVLLVDCDMRKPSVARTLNLDGRKGVSSILNGYNALEEALQSYDALPNLWVLPAGPIASSPAEILSGPAAESLLQKLRERFDYVVIDSPPLLAVTDATILSTLADGVLLVLEGGATPRRAASRARKMLDSTGARLIGFALNKIDSRHGDYYGYYGRYYSYGESQRAEERHDDLAEAESYSSRAGD